MIEKESFFDIYQNFYYGRYVIRDYKDNISYPILISTIVD